MWINKSSFSLVAEALDFRWTICMLAFSLCSFQVKVALIFILQIAMSLDIASICFDFGQGVFSYFSCYIIFFFFLLSRTLH